MTIQYAVDHERRVILETWLGDVSASDLASHWRRILVDPEILAIRRTLVDLRQGNIGFTGPELARMVRSIAIPMIGGKHWKSALVIERPVQFGISRQYQVFAETYSEDAIFHDPEAAMRWLLG